MLAIVSVEVPPSGSVAASADRIVIFAELAVGHGTGDHETTATVGSEVVWNDWRSGGVLADVFVEVPASGTFAADAGRIDCATVRAVYIITQRSKTHSI